MLGVNVDAGGSVSAERIVATGARLARYVGFGGEEQAEYTLSLLGEGLLVVIVLGSEPDSIGPDPEQWAANIRALRDQYPWSDVIWQCGNEPDAAPDSPSSWRMSQQTLDELIATARVTLGVQRTLIGPGLCSGLPGWLHQLHNLPLLNGIGVHPYAKFPAPPEREAELRWMLEQYRAFGLPLWVTEYDSRTLGLAAYLRDFPGVEHALAFALHDGVPEFQMHGDTLADFVAAAASQNAPESHTAGHQGAVAPAKAPVVTGPAGEWIGDGLLRAVNRRGWVPLRGEEQGRLACAEGFLEWIDGRAYAVRWETA